MLLLVSSKPFLFFQFIVDDLRSTDSTHPAEFILEGTLMMKAYLPLQKRLFIMLLIQLLKLQILFMTCFKTFILQCEKYFEFVVHPSSGGASRLV